MPIIPIDDDLIARAATRAAETGRTIVEQINYWVRLGIEVDPDGTSEFMDDA